MLVFKVCMPGGHEYRLHEDGKIEGFGDGAVLFNYYPLLVREAIYSSGANGMCSSPAQDTKIATSERLGGGHLTPP
jgi:hypothetical protein